ncbi:hypothetical protein ACFL4J_01890 [Candidatus Margulisiibacteriota bacterium]
MGVNGVNGNQTQVNANQASQASAKSSADFAKYNAAVRKSDALSVLSGKFRTSIRMPISMSQKA